MMEHVEERRLDVWVKGEVDLEGKTPLSMTDRFLRTMSAAATALSRLPSSPLSRNSSAASRTNQIERNPSTDSQAQGSPNGGEQELRLSARRPGGAGEQELRPSAIARRLGLGGAGAQELRPSARKLEQEVRASAKKHKGGGAVEQELRPSAKRLGWAGACGEQSKMAARIEKGRQTLLQDATVRDDGRRGR